MSGYASDRQALIELADVAYYFDQLGAATIPLDGWPHPSAYGIDARRLEEWITALRERLQLGERTMRNARDSVRDIYLGSYNPGGR